MRVAIRVDAGSLIGGGHAMRCLTLADLLASRGASVLFVTAGMPDWIARRVESSGHQLARIPVPAGLMRTETNWHEPPLETASQATDAAATGEAAGRVDWLVVDHYLLDAAWHSAARDFAAHVLVIDDLANRSYDCELLLDQNFGRTDADYRGKVPRGAAVLAGPDYALLRPQFERERRHALDRRKRSAEIRRILVSLGTTDVGGLTSAIVRKIIERLPECAIDVVLGSEAPSLQAVRELAIGNRQIEVHVDETDMAILMRNSDLAIGAAGTTSWERCCLGLPTIAMILAENQRSSALALAEAGAIVPAPTVDEAADMCARLASDPEACAQMSAAAVAIVDGRGTERVADRMFGEGKPASRPLTLRRAAPGDSGQLWLWRNDPVTRAQSRNSAPIPWDVHDRWFANALKDPHRHIWIAEIGTTPVGSLNFRSDEHGSEVSIALDRNQRGIGLGKVSLTAALAHVPSGPVYASVRAENEPSRRLFESCGFHPVESDQAGFVRYSHSSQHRRRKRA